MLDARADFTRRVSLITRRRQYRRLRRAGGIFGWTAGIFVMLALVISAAAGLR